MNRSAEHFIAQEMPYFSILDLFKNATKDSSLVESCYAQYFPLESEEYKDTMEKVLTDAPKAGVVARILTAIRAGRFVTTKLGRI